ncbi:glycoside hydrolase family 79 protein [Aplosporella prunicola CBS 121167]|uniref:Glycoside hydrolase family 79 protein n=1 Tax=Aplosporella prunicola CBS 121167 TaxID=1176127 RepID=A0A6A6BH69_9PEZI|nr:glycoside hydrolase family 79 protein [Aplosporella prunicola CBS 121167]KAF2141901.1 glycoside hydrolase family 79 protein [Aplosporella prunicola CBS 121167]
MLWSTALVAAQSGTTFSRSPTISTIAVHPTPTGSGGVIPEGFVSFSIELSSFPDFAGNSSVGPNLFSYNLLNNIGNLTGTKPYIRVGGNTQDLALYDASLGVAENGIVDPERSEDYPTTLTIGPSFFESYDSWPGVKFIHGFNLGKNGTDGRESLLATVPLACKALSDGKLLYWELGNEPDLFKTSAKQGIVRPTNWTEHDYVQEYLNGTRAIRAELAKACPDLATDDKYKFIAPSFAGTSNSLDPIKTWQEGFDEDKNIALISSHNYIDGATEPGVTLQGTLMSHTSTVNSISKQLNVSRLLSNYSLPFILGETNSLYNQGASGLSDSFGAALWGIDFNLWCASVGIKRVHMHQGTNYRYASWQPVDTDKATKGTKAPYYGNIGVAAALGDLTAAPVRVDNLPLPEAREAAYATYGNDALQRVTVVNLREYNATQDGGASERPETEYWFGVPTACNGTGVVQRVMASGSDALTGASFNGLTYGFERDQGRPVLLGNATKDEIVWVGQDGVFGVSVPWSSAAIVQLKC